DGTINKIKTFKNIKLIISKGATIAKGRNIAVKNAKYPIIAMTDAGCICDKNWLRDISKPFKKTKTQVVAGFYRMSGESSFQKALKPFLGIMPDKFNEYNFLPSTRSVAFKKITWKKLGGFSEKFDRAGEDTDFNIKIIKKNIEIVRVKSAIVNWEVPNNLISSLKKFFFYAKGDVQSGNYLTSHNIKVLSIFVRYLVFISLSLFIFIYTPLVIVFVLIFSLYLTWSVYKHRRFIKGWKAWGYTAIIQIASDFAVMAGFLSGTWDILSR
ncbi:MAG TPA: glycosyltransferase, partial [Candidatus Saccharimonadales bacterium]|nr:glycosyltransferase [Candidatus Saccharimonadales bacterium]